MVNGLQDTFPVAAAWVLLVVLAIVGVYDFLAVIYWPDGYTISAYLYSLSRKFPVIPVLVGLVMGHLFWPVYPSLQSQVKAVVREAEKNGASVKIEQGKASGLKDTHGAKQ